MADSYFGVDVWHSQICLESCFGLLAERVAPFEVVRVVILAPPTWTAFIDSCFEEHKFDVVVNLAAQAGVRYSITNPDVYIESNVIGFYNILEACRHSYDQYEGGVKHLVYASSSSVYGSNKKVPYSTEDKVDNPVSLYAATKKSNVKSVLTMSFELNHMAREKGS